MKSSKITALLILLTLSIVIYNAQLQSAAASDAGVQLPVSNDSAVEKTEPNTIITEEGIEVDTIKTNKGDLKIYCIGHGTLMFDYLGKIIHVDPVSQEADYTKLPKADMILITHEHGDHLDTNAINAIKKEGTQILLTQTCSSRVAGGQVMKNGDTKTIDDIKIDAVPAYNLDPETRFHPKGRGNGYVLTFGDKKVYVAGDTENIPEMKNLKDIYIAFLPMNLPYTMSPEMAAEAAKVIKPKILYPYHFSQTDTSIIVELLKDSGIEVRIRKLD